MSFFVTDTTALLNFTAPSNKKIAVQAYDQIGWYVYLFVCIIPICHSRRFFFQSYVWWYMDMLAAEECLTNCRTHSSQTWRFISPSQPTMGTNHLFKYWPSERLNLCVVQWVSNVRPKDGLNVKLKSNGTFYLQCVHIDVSDGIIYFIRDNVIWDLLTF